MTGIFYTEVNMQSATSKHNQAYSARFAELTSLLEQSQALWQVRAFEAKHLPWQTQFPTLATAVWALDDSELDALDASQQALVTALSPALSCDLQSLGMAWPLSLLSTPWSDKSDIQHNLADHTGVNSIENAPSETMHFEGEAHFSAHIKGRKWQQITAFVQHLPQVNLPVLEWCAGKGHLGRLIAKTRGVDVVSVEWQAPLCQQGQQFAEQWQLSQRFICADAFALTEETNPLMTTQQAVALHACGDLHVRLLRLAAKAGTQAVAISPCCYHLIHASHYQALSIQGQQSALKLSRHDLQLPLQQSVLANPKQQALRHQEIAWRLGFDALQRQCRQQDVYLPLPTVKQSQLSGTFEAFCHWAVAQKAVDLGENIDFDAWLAAGYARQKLTRRIDLVAHLFRVALEQWLLLDRVCFLQQHGYHVSLSEFCPNSITPRNALILAIKNHK